MSANVEIDMDGASKWSVSTASIEVTITIAKRLEQLAIERAAFRRGGVQLAELTKVCHYMCGINTAHSHYRQRIGWQDTVSTNQTPATKCGTLCMQKITTSCSTPRIWRSWLSVFRELYGSTVCLHSLNISSKK
jgi:hypothetical protein